MKLILCDSDDQVVSAWKGKFYGCESVEMFCGNIFDLSADTIICPANSFGFINSGTNVSYSAFFGNELQKRIQKAISEKMNGELIVGNALVIETGHPVLKNLVLAPSMRVTEKITKTVNAYLSFRAALIAINEHNRQNETIRNVLSPGIGVYNGGLTPLQCAYQMFSAYRKIVLGRIEFPNEIFEAQDEHTRMTLE